MMIWGYHDTSAQFINTGSHERSHQHRVLEGCRGCGERIDLDLVVDGEAHRTPRGSSVVSLVTMLPRRLCAWSGCMLAAGSCQAPLDVLDSRCVRFCFSVHVCLYLFVYLCLCLCVCMCVCVCVCVWMVGVPSLHYHMLTQLECGGGGGFVGVGVREGGYARRGDMGGEGGRAGGRLHAN